MSKIDLTRMNRLIAVNGKELDATAMPKNQKVWCFRLQDRTSKDLSVDRKDVYDIRQVIEKIPGVVSNMYTTIQASFYNDLGKYAVPERYKVIGDLDSLFNGLSHNLKLTNVQKTYLLLEILLDYEETYRNIFNSEELCLVRIYAYIIYNNLVKIALLLGEEVDLSINNILTIKFDQKRI
jgi:hypothetical protein